MEHRLFLVPPKLQRGLLLIGLKVSEWVIILALVVTIFITRSYSLIAIPIAIYCLCCRPTDNKNAFGYLKTRFRYYLTAQQFTRKELAPNVKKTANRKPR